MFARRLGFGSHVQQAVRFQSERWDDKGPAYGLKGNAPPIAAHILHLAQVVEHWHGLGGRAVAKTRAREARGKRFDPGVAGVFLSLAEHEEFWRELEDDWLHAHALAMRPATLADLRTEAQIDEVCEALADFADIRARPRWNHSPDVVKLPVGIAERLRLSRTEQRRTCRAALLHDLGVVTVPLAVLEKPEPLSEGEREYLRLHSHYTERELERVGPLCDLALEASADHEWVNGEGYHHRLIGDQIPLIGRIVAVADRYLSPASEHQDSPESAPSLSSLAPLVGTQLDAQGVTRSCSGIFRLIESALTGSRHIPAHKQMRSDLR